MRSAMLTLQVGQEFLPWVIVHSLIQPSQKGCMQGLKTALSASGTSSF